MKKLNLSKQDIIKMFHLDKINKDEIKNQCFDFRFFPKRFGSSIKMDESSHVIFEAAERTLSPEEVKKELSRAFSINDWQIHTRKECNDVEVLILISNIGNNKKSVIDSLSNFGWFFVGEQDVILDNINWIVLSFDPIYQEDISGIFVNVAKILHWTPYYNIDNIKENGLVPKSENKLGMHPDRVYFFTGNVNIDTVISFGKSLYEHNKNINNDGRYVLLSVKTSDLRGIKFSYDPRAEQSYYTYETINPDIINVEMIYDFKSNNKLK
jgi:hypothetical protein